MTGGPGIPPPAFAGRRKNTWGFGLSAALLALGLHALALALLLTMPSGLDEPGDVPFYEMDLTAFGRNTYGGDGGSPATTPDPAMPPVSGKPAEAASRTAKPLQPKSAPPSVPEKSPLPSKNSESASAPSTAPGTSRPAEGRIQGHGAGNGQDTYGPGQVERPPRLLRKIDPIYPQAARRQGISGKMVVKFLVGPDGRVRDIEVVEAEPSGYFEQAAVDAVSRWEFSPGMLRGRAVAVWMLVPLSFSLR
ncbi:TonB family protein [Desulfovibrio aminophilus]|uniref:energy transducer TonB n=1 Tax=Desulfovibrio aminophilus TaxID=81425 RepID=UPI0033984BA8